MLSGRRDPRRPATDTAAASEPEADRHTLIVPGPDVAGGRTFLVNFPGYVRNEDRALATLGGIDGLAAQRATHPKTLQLRLRPGDPTCHPLISDDARSASCLVLRLSRPTGTGATAAAADVEAELVAAVDRAYSFSSPADYQYTGRDLRPEEVQWAGREEHVAECPPFLQPAPLLVTPPVFAVESPLDYGFRQYKAADHGVDVLGRRNKPRGPAPTWVDFLASDVPAAADEGAWVGSAAGEGAAARLGELLRRRPIYLEGALAAALGEEGGSGGKGGFPSTRAHMEALCALCYRFRNGPWQGAWVRRGYDPRNDPGARSTQVLSHAMPAEWWRAVAAAKEAGAAGSRPGSRATAAAPETSSSPALPPLAPTYAALTSFSGVQATPMAALQLCDVADTEVAAALANPSNVAPAVNEASGWLTPAAWEGVKARVASRFEALWAEAAAAAGGAAEGAGPSGGVPGAAETGEQADILPEGLLTELTTYLEAEKRVPGAEGAVASGHAEEEEEEEEDMLEEEGGVEEEESEEEEEGHSGDDEDGGE